MKCFLIIYLSLLTGSLCAQDTAISVQTYYANKNRIITPYNPKGKDQNWGIKVAILPYIIGNGWGIGSVMGVEYGFFKRHSIGIDAGYYYFTDTDDMITDTAGVKHDVGNERVSNERSVFLSYRYYFNFQKLREKKGLAVYASCYARYGEISEKLDPLYPNIFIKEEEINRSLGIVLGAILNFKGDSKGFDFNTGVYTKQHNITDTYYDNGIVKSRFTQKTTIGIRVGLYLNFSFIRR